MQADFKKIMTQIPEIGEDMHKLMVELFPICRSITGNGLRKTLKILKHLTQIILPLILFEIILLSRLKLKTIEIF